MHTEWFICDFLFVSVEILKCKICIYQITGVSLFLDFVSFFSVFLKQQIARDAHRLVSTYCITRESQWGGAFYGYRLKFWLFYVFTPEKDYLCEMGYPFDDSRQISTVRLNLKME